MSSNTQARKFLITINNPEEHGFDHDTILLILESLLLDFYCLAYEIGANGTKHIHIFIYRHSPIRFRTLKEKFSIAHIDKAMGSCQENKDYVMKDGKYKNTSKAETSIEGTYEEYGEMPSEKEQQEDLMKKVQLMLLEGESIASIVEQMPKFSFKVNELEVLRETLLSEKFKQCNRDVEVTYIFGRTGSGKTRSVYEAHNSLDICRITNYDKGVKFDAYHGQDVLVFDEFRSQIPISDLLNYLDIYPLSLPARYHDKTACYTKVYLISNIPLNQQYREIYLNQVETYNALLRRINHIYEQIDFEKRLEIDKDDMKWI